MGQFICRDCEVEHGARVTDYSVVACCELCGVLRGDWGWKRVALTAGRPLARYQAAQRAKVLQQIAGFEADLRRPGRPATVGSGLALPPRLGG